MMNINPRIGSDPELFFADPEGRIVGAEKVIGKEPLKAHYCGVDSTVVLDGVQVELHPTSGACRQIAGGNVGACFKAIATRLRDLSNQGKKFDVCFSGVVEVTQEELQSLSEETRQFGCQPSSNVYNMGARDIPNGAEYLVRAGGGHIHIGDLPPTVWLPENSPYKRVYTSLKDRDERRRIIPMMDAIVGNTCVLLDRDPKQAERRKYYGRAGEYRLQPHGIEYRTLSNFWLRSYELLSLVYGLSRLSVRLLARTLDDTDAVDYEDKLLSKIDFEAMIEAINTNNADLAKKNWKVVRDFICQLPKKEVELMGTYYGYGVTGSNMHMFDKFLQDVEVRGLEGIWPTENILKTWVTRESYGSNGAPGWERWLEANYKR